MQKGENISYSLKEKANNKEDVTYDDIVNIVNYMDINNEPDMGDFVAQEVRNEKRIRRRKRKRWESKC